MKYISELQGVDKVEKNFFLPHTQMENTPLSGNFFGVMESCHFLTRAILDFYPRESVHFKSRSEIRPFD